MEGGATEGSGGNGEPLISPSVELGLISKPARSKSGDRPTVRRSQNAIGSSDEFYEILRRSPRRSSRSNSSSNCFKVFKTSVVRCRISKDAPIPLSSGDGL